MKKIFLTLGLILTALAPTLASAADSASADLKLRCGRFFLSRGVYMLNDGQGLWNVYSDSDRVFNLESRLSRCVCMSGFDTAEGPNGIRAFNIRSVYYRAERACRDEGL